ncbi:MAG: preprotein translocase subunit SecG [Clostridia bacterium]|nr:preprotein translocase subunit SecG [Clostridia bacterium]
MNIVFGIILLVAALFLIVSVLMQSGKSHNLSGSIAGGAETFFGKTKGKTIDKVLSKVTSVVAVIFVLLVIVVYVIQPNAVDDHAGHDHEDAPAVETSEVVG